ncbi:nesprin-1 [Caerostris extrusa]|uniref:Nesprin-1 n=1 Tax=Caerostris extrusa TaxID=172846 RepID=A0AAV4P7G2_CAEEX|nr:nesprin-1 [Caerostris extrusa]
MKSGNRMQLENDLRNLKERLHRVEDALSEKLQMLDEAIAQQREQKWQFDESSRKLEEIREEIVHLSKPLGPYTSDAEFVLENYEKLLHRLLDLNERLQSIKPLSSFVDVYSNLIEKYSEVIQQVQDKLAKAKQSLSIRDQYHTLVKEINETIYTCNDNLTTVNAETLPADKKLTKYQTLLDDITHCEATYTKASDKRECSWWLTKRNVCHAIPASFETVLERSPKEINKHKDLASDLKKCLNEASTLTNQIDVELQSGNLPGSFLEQVEECNLFQQTLVMAMEEQLQYLKSAFDIRKEFEKLAESLNKWLNGAEQMLDVSTAGVDFQNLDSTYNELQKYFSDISTYENQLSDIQKLGSQIHPTLLEDQVSLLESEIDSLKKKLSKILNMADRTITEVEVDCILWKEYRELVDTIFKFLKTPIPAEKPASVSAINAVHQETVSPCSRNAEEPDFDQRIERESPIFESKSQCALCQCHQQGVVQYQQPVAGSSVCFGKSNFSPDGSSESMGGVF